MSTSLSGLAHILWGTIHTFGLMGLIKMDTWMRPMEAVVAGCRMSVYLFLQATAITESLSPIKLINDQLQKKIKLRCNCITSLHNLEKTAQATWHHQHHNLECVQRKNCHENIVHLFIQHLSCHWNKNHGLLPPLPKAAMLRYGFHPNPSYWLFVRLKTAFHKSSKTDVLCWR